MYGMSSAVDNFFEKVDLPDPLVPITLIFCMLGADRSMKLSMSDGIS